MTKLILLGLAVGAAIFILGPFLAKAPTQAAMAGGQAAEPVGRVVKSDAEWRKILTPQQFNITRRKGTEPAFSGKYHNHKAAGVYTCVACGLELFDSKSKFDSGTGWPSFYEPVKTGHVLSKPDNSFFMRRVEVLCARCDAHLGHVFKDGPPPTGLRYCINSAALNFVPASEVK